jgi:hypothetical protein
MTTPAWPVWTTHEEILRIQAELARETDSKKRYSPCEQQHLVFYEKVPVARYGDLHGLHVMRSYVKGDKERLGWIRFQTSGSIGACQRRPSLRWSRPSKWTRKTRGVSSPAPGPGA